MISKIKQWFADRKRLILIIDRLKEANSSCLEEMDKMEEEYLEKIRRLELDYIKSRVGEIQLYVEKTIGHQFYGRYYFWSDKKLPSFECDWDENMNKYKCYVGK